MREPFDYPQFVSHNQWWVPSESQGVSRPITLRHRPRLLRASRGASFLFSYAGPVWGVISSILSKSSKRILKDLANGYVHIYIYGGFLKRAGAPKSMVYKGKSHWFGSTSILGNHCIYNYIYIIIHICISVYIYIYTFVGTHETLVLTTLSLWQTPQTPWFSEHFSHGASNASHIYIYIIVFMNFKEMEVSYTHSFSCLVSFLTGRHVATYLFGSSMAKTGCRRCPLVSPSLFEASVVFGVLIRICSFLTVFGDFIS